MSASLTGFTANEPVNTPVLGRVAACRSTSRTPLTCATYTATASAGLSPSRVQSPGVPAGHAPPTNLSRPLYSGATTMNVAPNSVSGRVVYTSIDPPPTTGNVTRAPVDRPIQLRCITLIGSGQSNSSRSVRSRSAYAVMRIFHCRSGTLNTGKLPRSLRPSDVTSSLASTVPSAGHQLTSASSWYTRRMESISARRSAGDALDQSDTLTGV